jgi:two-component system phosphate regulon response regulator OmpR
MDTLPDNAAHILVVDDDQRIRDLLARYLFEQGFRVSTATDAASARAAMRGLAFDVVILDVMMPGESGLELARSIRNSAGGSGVPILMLTAKHEIEHRIEGLQAGADDYLAKPFEPRELSLRVSNILRRASPPAAPPADSVRFGKFVFHIARGELRKGEQSVKLTDRERDMLRTLAKTPGETVSRLELSGNGTAVSERAVDVLVNRLRRKIERTPDNPLFVQTVRGVGYRLVVS